MEKECVSNFDSDKYIKKDILVEIFSNLNIKELCKISLVSKKWLLISNEPRLFRYICKRDFPSFYKEKWIKDESLNEYLLKHGWKSAYHILKCANLKREINISLRMEIRPQNNIILQCTSIFNSEYSNQL